MRLAVIYITHFLLITSKYLSHGSAMQSVSLMTFRLCNESNVAPGGPMHSSSYNMSPHAEIAQQGWRACRWEDREDVLTSRGLWWDYRRGLEAVARGREVGPSAGERARARGRGE